jgi:2-keto-4-pentenoate hydratase/2-oxohepta-3-ene-1,7-dioic acid hydratase in catechol pathway
VSSYALVRADSARGVRAGVKVGVNIYDVADALQRPDLTSIGAILAGGAEVAGRLDSFATTPVIQQMPLTSMRLLAPVEDPSGIFCVGVNYANHAAAMAKAHGIPGQPSPKELGLNPWFFIKTAHALMGPDSELHLPSVKLDWEAELAAVIGRPARNVSVERALEHVGGYTIANDLSARDRAQRPKLGESSPFKFDWVAHKNFAGACPLGPALVPASAISDPQCLGIRLWVNQQLKQDSNTRQMIFTLAEQIAFLSTLLTLRVGDVILTGTPAGTGAESQQFLNRGDTVDVEIEKLGRLTTRIV